MRPARWWCALFLVLAPAPLLLAVVHGLGVNTLFADELSFAQFIWRIREGGSWTSAGLFSLHNEHRVVPMKLAMAILQGPTRWSQIAEMYVSACLSALTIVVCWRLYRAGGGTASAGGLLEFAPVAWLLSSLSQYENQFFGLMMCHYFTVLGASASLLLLVRGGAGATALAVVAAAIGAFSIGSGFLAFPAGMLILAAQRASWRRWLIWCGGGGVAIAGHLRDYVTPEHTRPLEWTASTIVNVSSLWLTTLGAPLAAGSVHWAFAAAPTLLGVAALLAVKAFRDPSRRQVQAAAVALIVFGVASAAMVAVGRVAMHGDPLGSRYITYTNFAWVGVYFLVLQHARVTGDGRWKVASVSLLVPALAAANLHGLDAARRWQRERLLDQYVLQTYYQQPDSVLARLAPVPLVRRVADYLRSEGLSAFAVPQQMQFLTSADNSVASGEVLAGRAVDQRLRCPVETLYDVAVMVLPAARPGGAFEVTLRSGAQLLATRSVPAAAIKEWTWVRVPLDAPYPGCLGVELQVRIESLNTQAGTSVSVLAAPPTYDGALAQAGAPIAGKRLALALNAYRLGVLKEPDPPR